MALLRNNNGLLLNSNGDPTCDTAACCPSGPPPCNVEAASGGEEIFEETYTFPRERRKLFFCGQAFEIPDRFQVHLILEQFENVEGEQRIERLVFDSGEAGQSGLRCRCFWKPEGAEVRVRVDGTVGGSGTAWNFSLTCDDECCTSDCDCQPELCEDSLPDQNGEDCEDIAFTSCCNQETGRCGGCESSCFYCYESPFGVVPCWVVTDPDNPPPGVPPRDYGDSCCLDFCVGRVCLNERDQRLQGEFYGWLRGDTCYACAYECSQCGVAFSETRCNAGGPGPNCDSINPPPDGCFCDSFCYSQCDDCCSADADPCCTVWIDLADMWSEEFEHRERVLKSVFDDFVSSYPGVSEQVARQAFSMVSRLRDNGYVYISPGLRFACLLCLQDIADGADAAERIESLRQEASEFVRSYRTGSQYGYPDADNT
jgi:hypothetical protein